MIDMVDISTATASMMPITEIVAMSATPPWLRFAIR